MIENIKSVLVALSKEFGPEENSSVLGYGLSLAQAAGAHLTVQAASQSIHLRNQDVSRTIGSLVGAANERLRQLASGAVETARSDAAAAGVAATFHTPHLSHPALLASFLGLARVHDLAIVDAEPEAIHPDRDLLQALLVNSGRPLIVVPVGWDTFRAQRVLIAWDGSSRASRAVHDALPFLRAAQAVMVVAVTGEKELPASADGSDIAPHLVRHGVPAEVTPAAARDGDVAQALRGEAERHGADMIVMGGYVHSRLRELVFGGVTQSLLKSSPVPLLMSY
jgi:nucleotide-binding universal stress UspA family protein